MTVLTDEEMKQIHSDTFGKGVLTFARAVEQAVLDKLKQQEPIGTMICADGFLGFTKQTRRVPNGTKLYAAPVPADDSSV